MFLIVSLQNAKNGFYTAKGHSKESMVTWSLHILSQNRHLCLVGNVEPVEWANLVHVPIARIFYQVERFYKKY